MSERPRIVVTRWVPDEALAVLREAGEVVLSEKNRTLEPAELHELAAGAAALVTMVQDRVDGALADAAGPGLRVVANVAVGYDNVALDELAERDVLLTNTPGVLTEATADLGFGLLLAVTRRLGEAERLLREQRPWSFHLGFMLGTGIQGKTLGIVGLGQIGQAMARRARAFGMRIVYTGRSRADPGVTTELAAEYLPLPELLAAADVISLHCPLTPDTRHLIDAEALAAMRPGAFLINTTRGPVVDERALAEALAEGRIGGAGLDVFEREPEVEPALLTLDNVVLSPHLGSATVETRTEMALLAARNVAAVLAGNEPLTPVRQ